LRSAALGGRPKIRFSIGRQKSRSKCRSDRHIRTAGTLLLYYFLYVSFFLREKGKSLSRNTKPARLCGGSDGIDGLAAYEKLPERIPLRQFRFFF